MSESIRKTDSYCNPPKRDLYELDKEIRRQLYTETAKNEKILKKLHHKILNEFSQFDHYNFQQNSNPNFIVENFSKVNTDFFSKVSYLLTGKPIVSYLLTGKPIDYDVISSINPEYTAVERCQMIAEMFEKKYPDFPLILECEHHGYDYAAHEKDVRLRARINRKNL